MNLIKIKILRWLVVIFVCGITLTFAGCGVTEPVKDTCCSSDKLTFTEMVNLSKKAVVKEVPGSNFYIATALPGVRGIHTVYRGNESNELLVYIWYPNRGFFWDIEECTK